jgi:TolB-like protein
MIVAAVSGWVFGSLPPDMALNRARLVILPFNDLNSPEIADFNRALTEAFVIALTNADRENLAVIRPAATGRMLVAGLTPAEIAKRTQADFVLLGEHREADHVTFVEVLRAPQADHLFGHRFDLDESRPAYAPDDVVEAIAKAIDAARTAQEEGGS